MSKSTIPSSKLWRKFGMYFPYSVVDVIIHDKDGGILLTKRAIPPYKNKWHFPGGTIYKNNTLEKSVKLIAKKEVNLVVRVEKFVGVYQVKSPRHDISHAFLTCVLRGKIKLDFQSTEARFFKNPPKNIVPHQRKIFLDAKVLLKDSPWLESNSKMIFTKD